MSFTKGQAGNTGSFGYKVNSGKSQNGADKKSGQHLPGTNPSVPVNPVGSGSQDFLSEAGTVETGLAVVLGYVAGNAAEKMIRRRIANRKSK